MKQRNIPVAKLDENDHFPHKQRIIERNGIDLVVKRLIYQRFGTFSGHNYRKMEYF